MARGPYIGAIVHFKEHASQKRPYAAIIVSLDDTAPDWVDLYVIPGHRVRSPYYTGPVERDAEGRHWAWIPEIEGAPKPVNPFAFGYGGV